MFQEEEKERQREEDELSDLDDNNEAWNIMEIKEFVEVQKPPALLQLASYFIEHPHSFKLPGLFNATLSK